MTYTIDSVVILPNGNLNITYTLNSVQSTKEVTKEKICNITAGCSMS